MGKRNEFLDEMFYLSSEKNLDDEVEKIFQYYRKLGYPNYKKEDYNIQEEISKLKYFNEKEIFNKENKHFIQNMTGCGFLWTYFPHWTEVKCGNSKESLKDKWENDDELKELIRKTYLWKLKHNEPHWTHNRIRQNAKVFMSKQSVSNFRPTVAKYIYNAYGFKGTVLDMSSGFGGRYAGFLASSCKKYIGIDPSKKTYNGLLEMQKDFSYLGKESVFYCMGSEDFIPEKESIDLCFTSPPYFDTEKYSLEQTQSYLKYPTIDSWINGFLGKTIENCYYGLKKNRYCIINIANTLKYNNIVSSTISLCEQNNFIHEDTLFLELSSISGKGRKLEPILVFKKI